MSKTTLEFDVDDSLLDEFEENALVAFWKAAESLHTDVIQSQTIPFDTSHLQKETSVFPKKKGNHEYKLMSKTEYAHRLYNHPEYNFKKDENPNAGAGWFDTYIKGSKKNMFFDNFMKFATKGRK